LLALVRVHGENVAPGCRFPNSHGPVAACRGKALAVRAEGHGPDDGRVPLQRAQLLTGDGVVQLYTLARTTRQQLAVRAERHAPHTVRVLQRERGLLRRMALAVELLVPVVPLEAAQVRLPGPGLLGLQQGWHAVELALVPGGLHPGQVVLVALAPGGV